MDKQELARLVSQLLDLTMDELFCKGEGVHSEEVPDMIEHDGSDTLTVTYGEKKFLITVEQV